MQVRTIEVKQFYVIIDNNDCTVYPEWLQSATSDKDTDWMRKNMSQNLTENDFKMSIEGKPQRQKLMFDSLVSSLLQTYFNNR